MCILESILSNSKKIGNAKAPIPNRSKIMMEIKYIFNIY